MLGIVLAVSALQWAGVPDPGGVEYLVERARQRLAAETQAVARYQAISRFRVSVTLDSKRQRRLLFRRELAAEVDWRRDGPRRVHLRGGREVVPVALARVQVPGDLLPSGKDLAPDPTEHLLMLMPDRQGFSWDPLKEGGETHYRYALGDTLEIRLPDGRSITTVELRVAPRLADMRLVTGSYWVELDGYSIVRAVFRPSGEIDLAADLPPLEDGGGDLVVPHPLRLLRVQIRHVTVEYGLWDDEWWMPRLLLITGAAVAGETRVQVDLEVGYSDYRVFPDPLALPTLPPVIRRLAGPGWLVPSPRPYGYPIEVTAADTAELLASELLPESIFTPGMAVITPSEAEALERQLNDLPTVPLHAAPTRFEVPWTNPALTRFNRVEGLSSGIGVGWNVGPMRIRGRARVGTEAPFPAARLTIESTAPGRRLSLAVYRALKAANPEMGPLGLGNSLTALLFGRDEGVYFRAAGARAEVESVGAMSSYRVRGYAELQSAAVSATRFSLAHALGFPSSARPHPHAASATQWGVDIDVRTQRGLNPVGFSAGGWIRINAEVGDHRFVRSAAAVRTTFPLPSFLIAAAELGGGLTLGDAPPQSRWYLGGPPTLRGFGGGSISSREYVRKRLELANDLPAARLVLFSDAAWIGPVHEQDENPVSIGVGGSFLDGVLRLDLSRTIAPGEAWRVDIYFGSGL